MVGHSPGNFLNAVKEDVVKAVVVALAVATATGLAGALLSGAWQKALLAACGLILMLVFITLATAATLHAQRLEEGEFDGIRAEDAERRHLAKFERDQREHITRAAAGSGEAVRQSADVSMMLERCRKQISTGRASSIELLVVCDVEPNSPRPVEQAGRFDQAVLADPSRLTDWIESREDCVYAIPIQVDGEIWRVLGIADTTLDSYDKFELQRVATHIAALKLAHRAVGGASLEESS